MEAFSLLCDPNNNIEICGVAIAGTRIQSIAFLASLFAENVAPFLVVAPSSTLRNWEIGFTTWAPQMNVVCKQ